MEGDKILHHALERAALDRVSGDPLPGPLATAFCDTDIVAGGLHVRKVVPSDWIVLRTINSPILRLIEELRMNPKVDPKIEVTDEEHAEVVFQFTRTAKECRTILKQGKEHFRERAIEFMDAQDLHAVKVAEVVAAVMEQIRRSWETALHYQQEKEKDTKDFKETTPRTASGGGSNMLADSPTTLAGSPHATT